MVDIIIKIPNDKVDEFKLGFFKVYPNESGETDLKYLKSFIRQDLLNIYITGKTQIARETTAPDIDEGIVEE